MITANTKTIEQDGLTITVPDYDLAGRPCNIYYSQDYLTCEIEFLDEGVA